MIYLRQKRVLEEIIITNTNKLTTKWLQSGQLSHLQPGLAAFCSWLLHDTVPMIWNVSSAFSDSTQAALCYLMLTVVVLKLRWRAEHPGHLSLSLCLSLSLSLSLCVSVSLCLSLSLSLSLSPYAIWVCVAWMKKENILLTNEKVVKTQVGDHKLMNLNTTPVSLLLHVLVAYKAMQ